ncbi:MAG: glycosyltransferase [Nitrospirae bacterium]|nr:glycosyltransferase [Nitrospirota bacterium]
MQTFFEKNLSVLRGRDPGLAEFLVRQETGTDLQIVESRTGMPSLKVDNNALHSLYDPLKEAEAWVRHYEKEISAASSMVVFGFGLGYHIAELCRETDKEITVFEPRPDILKAALGSVCLEQELARVRLMTDMKNPALTKGDTGGFYGQNFAVLHHGPSISISSKYFETVQARFNAMESINRGLRILVVSPVHGGSLPIARYCSTTLKRMGHEVELVDNGGFYDAMLFARDVAKSKLRFKRMMDSLSAFLSEAVIARCEAFKPDLVLALAQAPLTEEYIRKIRSYGIATAFWFVEDFRVMDYWRKIAGHYDYFFTIQKGDFFEELKGAGIKNYHYLPLAADPDFHKKARLTDEEEKYYRSDVSFLGAGYFNRRHFLRGLLDFDFKIWGDGWPRDAAFDKCVQRSGARIETEETVRIFSATRININLHSSTYHRGINPFGDFVNPRTFELAACGAFQLVDRRRELDGLFDAGEEIVVFDDIEDLRRKIKYYLDNPGEREIIAERAAKRILREHTYEHRMRDMFEFLAGRGFNLCTGSEGGENVEGLIEEAGEGSGLAQYLSRFRDRGRITLSDITEDIYEGAGEISRAESVFLLMNELMKK